MIFGDCPYLDCQEPFCITLMTGPLPALERHHCEKCRRVIWTQHSRANPESWTDEDARKQFAIDDYGKEAVVCHD